jgi:glycosyltransferase involved in cell wall biosynthesis
MLVSILINNYNYSRFLRRAIDSALDQTYRQIEVVVVDDGSTDNSREIISSYGNKVVPIFKANGGQSSAFNTGFAASHGELICFLDADDEFLSSKVQRIVDAQNTLPDTWYFHQLQFADEDSGPISGSPVNRQKTGVHDFRSDSLKGKDTFWAPATSGLSFSRRLLESLLPMPDDIRITSDNYIKCIAIALAPGMFIAERLSLQRIHGKNAYTLNYDPMLRAEIKLLTGKAISQRHPCLRKIGDRLVASGLGGRYRAGKPWRNAWQELIDYTSLRPVTEKGSVYARFLYSAFFKDGGIDCDTSSPPPSTRACLSNGLPQKVAAADRRA